MTKARHCEKLSSISKLDSLGMVAVKPIEFRITSPIPYINLATPVLYKLNSYKTLNESQYVSKFENRLSKLRTGAEDELTQMDATLIEEEITNRNVEIYSVPLKEELTHAHHLATTSTSNKQNTISDETSIKNKKIIDLIPSKKLSEPSEYSAMHIFVILSSFFSGNSQVLSK